jgi:hypothetical protein
VALQRDLEAEGELAAYSEIGKVFRQQAHFTALADIVTEIHDDDTAPPGDHDATSAEDHLAYGLGQLQAQALALKSASLAAESAGSSRAPSRSSSVRELGEPGYPSAEPREHAAAPADLLVTSHTVSSASVGDMREARNAGHSPATAPMRIAAPMPPAQASAGMTIASDLLDA